MCIQKKNSYQKLDVTSVSIVLAPIHQYHQLCATHRLAPKSEEKTTNGWKPKMVQPKKLVVPLVS